jgi:hypothetical protein
MGKVTVTEWEIRYRSLHWETEEFSDYVSVEECLDEAEAMDVYRDLKMAPNAYTDVHLMKRTVVRDEAEWEEVLDD